MSCLVHCLKRTTCTETDAFNCVFEKSMRDLRQDRLIRNRIGVLFISLSLLMTVTVYNFVKKVTQFDPATLHTYTLQHEEHLLSTC